MPRKLKFELSLFEDLLHGPLHPNVIEETLKTTAQQHFTGIIRAEADRVWKALRNYTCSPVEEQQLERNIQMHQQEAVRLLNQVYAYVRPEGEERYALLRACTLCTAVYAELKAGLKTVLNYIEGELDRFFDLNQTVPDSFRVASAKTLMEERNLLWARFKARGLDMKLQELILGFIANHCERPGCSYQEQRYVKLLTGNLLKALKSERKKNWNRRIVVELIYLNFNKSTFFQWCRRFIAAEVDGIADLREQVARFNWYLKEISPVNLKPNVSYKTGRPAIKDLLNTYITAELVYLGECNQQNPGTAVRDLKERAERFDFKLPLSLSAAQLGLIAQLFIETGVFKIEKGQIMMVMRFFSEHVTTAGTEQLSAENLYKLRKKADARVCKVIEEILERMLALLRDVYMQ